jgi:hypothetical protein
MTPCRSPSPGEMVAVLKDLRPENLESSSKGRASVVAHTTSQDTSAAGKRDSAAGGGKAAEPP